MKRKIYEAKVTEADIYDGDTIHNVSVLIYPLDNSDKDSDKDYEVELWPDIYLTPDGIRCKFSLRLYGIDSPEMHPHHIRDDGTVRTQESLDKEKALAQKSKQGLIDYLKEHNWTIYLEHPMDGKYASRFVAKAFVKDEQGKLRSVSNYMIMKSFARQYFGGHKGKWL